MWSCPCFLTCCAGDDFPVSPVEPLLFFEAVMLVVMEAAIDQLVKRCDGIVAVTLTVFRSIAPVCGIVGHGA
jgi:hypothetical protein